MSYSAGSPPIGGMRLTPAKLLPTRSVCPSAMVAVYSVYSQGHGYSAVNVVTPRSSARMTSAPFS
jgi:hypothetical protein